MVLVAQLATTPGWAQSDSVTISMEVLTTGSTNIGHARDAHEWVQLLRSLPIDSVSMRRADGQSKPNVESSESGSAKSLKVTALLNQQGRLQLPGATFRKSDKSQLRQWIADLKTSPRSEGSTYAFGLDADSLVSLTEKLESPLDISTKGKTVRQVFTAIRESSRLPIAVTSKAKQKLVSNSQITVEDELSGLSVGTSLAALLRPLGLVIAPEEKEPSSLRMVVHDVRAVEQTWPIGWPRETKPHKLIPKLHEFLEVEIDEVPIMDVLGSVQGRLEVPILYDHNGMARKDIDPKEALVSYPNKRTFYSKMMKNVLFQAKLKYEMRVDEAGRPFLWISPR